MLAATAVSAKLPPSLMNDRNEAVYSIGNFAVKVNYSDPGNSCEGSDDASVCALDHMQTTVSFSQNVVVDGYHLFKGDYAITATKAENNSIMLTFHQLDSHEYQLVNTTFEVTAQNLSNAQKASCSLSRANNKTNMLIKLNAGNLQIPLEVEPLNSDKLIRSFEKLGKHASWSDYYQAAGYCLKYHIHMPQMSFWAKQAAALHPGDVTKDLQQQVRATSN